ncbi:type II toxin-antitoxin system Phd/YefM family antitoxin [Reyranella sp. CPCC 100927]|uniref:type II toxin-antitoxin system Phd/YefM family antitoxin n=1 Tax=Reyranella sp. CPCC 100927 TaxID=2599616 RepID=UPI0011B7DA3E|nr:type II toxin-antitoxin system Phd/YefM family antitoxin [Reyranella sp. CPCC 100927]TWT03135.1 type II toxin-antitoxin system Phd/YefM family antitoxin [Reyranella sp. CPCC 100927]
MGKVIGAAEFKAACLRIIDQMNQDREPVTITKRGKPVAVLMPVREPARRRSIIGAMRGSVLRFDDPFTPAVGPTAWNANHDAD